MFHLAQKAWPSFALLAVVVTAPLQAQTIDTTILKAGTQFSLVTVTALSSKTQRTGDMVALKTVSAVIVNSNLTIPAGTAATGQIAEARETAMLGQSGKLLLKPLYLTLANGQTIRIQGGFANKGKIAAEAVVGLAFIAVFSGKSANIPAGTQIEAYVLRDVNIR